MSQKSGFLIVSNGFFIANVGHTLTKNYNGTYWPLGLASCVYCTKVGVTTKPENENISRKQDNSRELRNVVVVYKCL